VTTATQDLRPTALAGLTSGEAATRLATDGPNVLPPPARPSLAKELGAQLFHFFALMLWVAGALALIAGMEPLGIAIFTVIVVNGTFAWAQEARAERAAERLRDLLPRRAIVVRDGTPREIDAAELVRGDVVVLTAGSRVSADLEVARANSLRVDTSLLTGESVPELVDDSDTLHAGSFVVEGEGHGIVVATGAATRLGSIAALTRAKERPRSPLAHELDRVVRVVAIIAVSVGIGFFAIALLTGIPLSDGLLFGIGVTVALVPEGLLPTVTLSLAIGAQRMAARHALVRRLDAVETLGSTTFVCTDKTGTLTRNEMSIVEVWTRRGTASIAGTGYEPVGSVTGTSAAVDETRRVAVAARRCSTGRAAEDDGHWVAVGDPMDAAADVLARRLGCDDDPARAGPDTRRFPFDPRRRRMSVWADGVLVVKGAPEHVLPRCTGDGLPDDIVAAMAARGLRVLAVAERRVALPPEDGDPDELERDLALLGLLGFLDPPREGARAAIAACREAGVRIAMVTGDHPATARAIAEQVGLLGSDGTVVDGGQLPDDDAVLGAVVDRDGIVIARVSPEDKLRIARALQARGHVVAMTGDGVNDGPALQQADIGIAMGASGTDVAREAAALVLLDDDFATIVGALEQGRATFSNVRRFLTYHLTDNVAELTPFVVWALSGGRFPLALGVLQVLALDLGTDVLPALALGAEPVSSRALHRPPHRGHLLDRSVLRRAFGVLGPAEAALEISAFLVAMAAAGWRPGDDFPRGAARRWRRRRARRSSRSSWRRPPTRSPAAARPSRRGGCTGATRSSPAPSPPSSSPWVCSCGCPPSPACSITRRRRGPASWRRSPPRLRSSPWTGSTSSAERVPVEVLEARLPLPCLQVVLDTHDTVDLGDERLDDVHVAGPPHVADEHDDTGHDRRPHGVVVGEVQRVLEQLLVVAEDLGGAAVVRPQLVMARHDADDGAVVVHHRQPLVPGLDHPAGGDADLVVGRDGLGTRRHDISRRPPRGLAHPLRIAPGEVIGDHRQRPPPAEAVRLLGDDIGLGDDADESPLVDDGQPADIVCEQQLDDAGERGVGRHGDDGDGHDLGDLHAHLPSRHSAPPLSPRCDRAGKGRRSPRDRTRSWCTPDTARSAVPSAWRRPSAVHPVLVPTDAVTSSALAPRCSSSSRAPCDGSLHDATTRDARAPAGRERNAMPRLVIVNTAEPGSSDSTDA
jgi:calcium-translocating P-type ATPase